MKEVGVKILGIPIPFTNTGGEKKPKSGKKSSYKVSCSGTNADGQGRFGTTNFESTADPVKAVGDGQVAIQAIISEQGILKGTYSIKRLNKNGEAGETIANGPIGNN